MRVQGPHSYDLSFGMRQGQEHVHEHEDEHEHEHLEDLERTERSPSCNKSIVDEISYQRPDHDFGRPEHEIDYINNCTSDDCPSDLKFKQEDKSHSKFDARMDKNT